MKPQICALLALVALAGLTAGCRGQTSKEAPVAILRNMYQQPRYNPQSYSAFFADHRTMRPPVEGTVAREMELSSAIAQGRTTDGIGFVDTIPAMVIERNGKMKGLLERGEERYGIYCTPCHDGLGNGEGMVIQRGNNPSFKPPSFHTEKVRQMPDGQLFQTITYGFNNMPAYTQIPTDDRWAIVAYVRALQLSQANNRGAQP